MAAIQHNDNAAREAGQNSYKKLMSGEWGIFVHGAVKVGDVVKVKTKKGEEKTETIAKVVWEKDGKAICAIKPTPRPNSGFSADADWQRNGCSTCRRLRRLCNRCSFDEYDC